MGSALLAGHTFSGACQRKTQVGWVPASGFMTFQFVVLYPTSKILKRFLGSINNLVGRAGSTLPAESIAAPAPVAAAAAAGAVKLTEAMAEVNITSSPREPPCYSGG